MLSILLLSVDIEINPSPNLKSNKCRVLFHKIRGLYNILCSLTLVSELRHVSEIFSPRFNKQALILRDSMPFIAISIMSGFSVAVRIFVPVMKYNFLEFALNLVISISLVFTETLN